MKIKDDFITNSSSCSYIIPKSKLTEKQIYQIKNHIEFCRMKGWHEFYLGKYSEWKITEIEGVLLLEASIDNFDMYEFCKKIGIDEKIITRTI